MKKLFLILLCSLISNLVVGQHNVPTGEAKTIDSLKTVLKKTKDDTTRLYLLTELISNTNDDNIWPRYNVEIKQIAEKNLAGNPSKKLKEVYLKYLAAAIGNQGYIDEQKGLIKEAFENYSKALKLFEEIGDQPGIAESFNNIAVLYDGQGDIEKALAYHLKSLKLREIIGDETGLAISLNNIGMTYQKQGLIEKAIDYFSRSLKLKEKIGNKNSIAFSLNNLGFIYQAQGELARAMEYYNKSLKLWTEVNNKDGILTALGNLASGYRSQHDTARAEALYKKTYEISTELGDQQGISIALGNLGKILMDKGDLNKALDYFLKSLEIAEKIGDKEYASNSLNVLGDVYIKQKKYAEAEKVVLKALEIGRQIGYPETIQYSSQRLKLIYTALKKFDKAYEMQELEIKMNDSLNNQATKRASLKQQFKYEYEKKAIADSLKGAEQIVHEQLKHEQEIKQQRLYTYGGIIGFVLMIIVAGVSFNAYRNKQKANTIINEQKNEVEKQKHIIEEKQKEIVDSINYAKRIQYTLLAHELFLKENLTEHFIFFKPKDIVSGDFYWASKNENRFYLAVCDSTGHGVPGAFMSLLNIGFLTEAINEKGIEQPNEILNHVRKRLIEGISKEGQRDGFDGILLCIDKGKKEITYAAANNSPLIIRNGEIQEPGADKMPVGIGEKTDDFKLFKMELKKGEMLYLYTDGYADQFGGPKGKKFKYKPLNQLLLDNASLAMEKQNELLNVTFENWKGNLEQVDDVLIIGIRL